MSIVVSTDVFCDNCPNWCATATVTGRRVAAREARETARADGWLIEPGRDLCPACAGPTTGFTTGRR